MKPDQPASSDSLAAAIAASAHILPDQGPIGVFIHHNTLHAFQHLRFHDAVQQAAALTGARPYLELSQFRSAWQQGRIAACDLDAVLAEHLQDNGNELLGMGLTRHQVWRALMLQETDSRNPVEINWAFRDKPLASRKLLDAAHTVVDQLPPLWHEPPTFSRHADLFRHMQLEDADAGIHEELIRLCAAFLDQGQSLSPMPGREKGFLQAVAWLYHAGMGSPKAAPRVADDFSKIAANATPAMVVIRECLQDLGVTDADMPSFITATASALAGWAGMFSRLERHPEESHVDIPVAFEEFLAVRLLLERRAIARICAKAGLPMDLHKLAVHLVDSPMVHRSEDALVLYTLAEAAGLDHKDLADVGKDVILTLWQELVACTPLQRRALWMDAYERWYYRKILDGIAGIRHRRLIPDPDTRPSAQYLFCMDEREESIRRAVEEQGSDWQTYGLAGFFGVAIDYKGLYDTTPAAYCPVVVTPAHEIHETPVYTHRSWHETRHRLRNAWRAARRSAHFHSRTLSGGVGFSFVLGPWYGLVTIVRTLFPHGSIGTHDTIAGRISPLPLTQLLALRNDDKDNLSARGKYLGFTLHEASERVAAVLNSIGLVGNFAPIVMVLGHGSTSLNNPHESAHDCGACGGRRGGANARLFAALANQPDVRNALREKGINIPADTWFIGGLHDTADDHVEYSDLGSLPHGLMEAFEAADHVLDKARRKSAAERCRRFEAADLPISPDAGLHHVETRARHLAQPRPEYGHCTNAVAIVGRRSLTRGLHLDRRAFLISYDPDIDPCHEIIERILAAAGPVGAGISLEYYFSSVDNERYGCGTKLPHNVIGLLGIMNGHKSDLRTGLPLQMVELHEPMRLLVVCEATPQALLQVVANQPEVRELVVNRWIQVASVDPDTGAMHLYTDRGFVPYAPYPDPLAEYSESAAYHGTRREHLWPAVITSTLHSNSHHKPHQEETAGV